MVEVMFFNTPYVLCDGDLNPEMVPDRLTTTEYCIGWTHVEKYQESFPVYICNCLYEYDK
jgi:hypothetical protein